MSGNNAFYSSAFVMLMVIMIMVFGAVIGFGACNEQWKRDAVKHGAAEYNATTGQWQWKK